MNSTESPQPAAEERRRLYLGGLMGSLADPRQGHSRGSASVGDSLTASLSKLAQTPGGTIDVVGVNNVFRPRPQPAPALNVNPVRGAPREAGASAYTTEYNQLLEMLHQPTNGRPARAAGQDHHQLRAHQLQQVDRDLQQQREYLASHTAIQPVEVVAKEQIYKEDDDSIYGSPSHSPARRALTSVQPETRVTPPRHSRIDAKAPNGSGGRGRGSEERLGSGQSRSPINSAAYPERKEKYSTSPLQHIVGAAEHPYYSPRRIDLVNSGGGSQFMRGAISGSPKSEATQTKPHNPDPHAGSFEPIVLAGKVGDIHEMLADMEGYLMNDSRERRTKLEELERRQLELQSLCEEVVRQRSRSTGSQEPSKKTLELTVESSEFTIRTSGKRLPPPESPPRFEQAIDHPYSRQNDRPLRPPTVAGDGPVYKEDAWVIPQVKGPSPYKKHKDRLSATEAERRTSLAIRFQKAPKSGNHQNGSTTSFSITPSGSDKGHSSTDRADTPVMSQGQGTQRPRFMRAPPPTSLPSPPPQSPGHRGVIADSVAMGVNSTPRRGRGPNLISPMDDVPATRTQVDVGLFTAETHDHSHRQAHFTSPNPMFSTRGADDGLGHSALPQLSSAAHIMLHENDALRADLAASYDAQQRLMTKVEQLALHLVRVMHEREAVEAESAQKQHQLLITARTLVPVPVPPAVAAPNRATSRGASDAKLITRLEAELALLRREVDGAKRAYNKEKEAIAGQLTDQVKEVLAENAALVAALSQSRSITDRLAGVLSDGDSVQQLIAPPSAATSVGNGPPAPLRIAQHSATRDASNHTHPYNITAADALNSVSSDKSERSIRQPAAKDGGLSASRADSVVREERIANSSATGRADTTTTVVKEVTPVYSSDSGEMIGTKTVTTTTLVRPADDTQQPQARDQLLSSSDAPWALSTQRGQPALTSPDYNTSKAAVSTQPTVRPETKAGSGGVLGVSAITSNSASSSRDVGSEKAVSMMIRAYADVANSSTTKADGHSEGPPTRHYVEVAAASPEAVRRL